MYKRNTNGNNSWLIFLFSTFLLVLASCHGPKELQTPEYPFIGYTDISPPYDLDVLKALDIASVEAMKLGFETAEMEAVVMENDTTYLVAYSPPRGVDTVFTDTSFYFIVHAGWSVDIVVSKKDHKVLKVSRLY